jgi:hypothetical protein
MKNTIAALTEAVVVVVVRCALHGALLSTARYCATCLLPATGYINILLLSCLRIIGHGARKLPTAHCTGMIATVAIVTQLYRIGPCALPVLMLPTTYRTVLQRRYPLSVIRYPLSVTA